MPPTGSICPPNDDVDSSAQQAGDIVHSALLSCLENATSISRTQATIARLRPFALQQESQAAAYGDVLVATIETTQPQRHNILPKLQQELIQRHKSSIRIRAVKHLTVPIHAERSCSQLVYHYLLPLSWLPDADNLLQWLTSDGIKYPPPSNTLRRFKDALRSATSRRVSHDISQRRAVGRFGSLAFVERRPWHNFADPKLQGMASPNHEAVWRTVDRAQITDFVVLQGVPHAVIEFRGDGFVQQQIRRMVAMAVAITHGWLPANAMDDVTKADRVLETPIAPAGRLYLAQTRFHFEEMQTSGQSLFDSMALGDVEHARNDMFAFQQELVRRQINETEWKWTVQLEHFSKDFYSRSRPIFQKSVPYFATPAIYEQVLNELRRIVASGAWPITSAARSKVIQSVATGTAGSFTVVSPTVEDAVGASLGNVLFPDLARLVFELEESLSNAERPRVTTNGTDSSLTRTRNTSSHCAINCNALFTPHVDTGRGAGQSLSMIVGLGDYEEGEIFVEGTAYDIRYQPLEFDGWKLRHWTSPFRGERFSLVWFTPEKHGELVRGKRGELPVVSESEYS